MAKKRRRKGESISGYFRGIFNEHPDWLEQKSNDEVLARYRADHQLSAEAFVEPKIKNTLANQKSILRRQQRTAGKGTPVGVRAPRAVGGAVPRLELLEEQIDDCLSAAKSLDPEGLKTVIRNLRAARNEVVWKLGQP